MLSTYETKPKLFGTYQKELPNLRVHKSLSCRQYGNATKEREHCVKQHISLHMLYRGPFLWFYPFLCLLVSSLLSLKCSMYLARYIKRHQGLKDYHFIITLEMPYVFHAEGQNSIGSTIYLSFLCISKSYWISAELLTNTSENHLIIIIIIFLILHLL